MAVVADPVRFAIFDWLDESGREQRETYEERLRMLELADRAGFYSYHLAEHHATELSTVPSPNLFLAAVAQRTRRLRLGPLSYILPLYDPVRLLEEICMLDQLSGGRLELGLSRGSTGEHIDGDPDKARAVFNEALEVILMGLSTGEIDYHGAHFEYDHVITRLRPAQAVPTAVVSHLERRLDRVGRSPGHQHCLRRPPGGRLQSDGGHAAAVPD